MNCHVPSSWIHRRSLRSAFTIYRPDCLSWSVRRAGLSVGMSWTADRARADQFRQRHAWYAPTAIYQTTISPAAVLALLERRGEGPEIVADPAMLSGICRAGSASASTTTLRRLTALGIGDPYASGLLSQVAALHSWTWAWSCGQTGPNGVRQPSRNLLH
jgi:hypothetical protein